ncbi:MAG: hypothetical protein OHK0017_06720 [Patescibacteria group bacterium]
MPRKEKSPYLKSATAAERESAIKLKDQIKKYDQSWALRRIDISKSEGEPLTNVNLKIFRGLVAAVVYNYSVYPAIEEVEHYLKELTSSDNEKIKKEVLHFFQYWILQNKSSYKIKDLVLNHEDDENYVLIKIGANIILSLINNYPDLIEIEWVQIFEMFTKQVESARYFDELFDSKLYNLQRKDKKLVKPFLEFLKLYSGFVSRNPKFSNVFVLKKHPENKGAVS